MTEGSVILTNLLGVADRTTVSAELGSRSSSEFSASVAKPRLAGLPLEISGSAHQQINNAQWISSFRERLRGATFTLSGCAAGSICAPAAAASDAEHASTAAPACTAQSTLQLLQALASKLARLQTATKHDCPAKSEALVKPSRQAGAAAHAAVQPGLAHIGGPRGARAAEQPSCAHAIEQAAICQVPHRSPVSCGRQERRHTLQYDLAWRTDEGPSIVASPSVHMQLGNPSYTRKQAGCSTAASHQFPVAGRSGGTRCSTT